MRSPRIAGLLLTLVIAPCPLLAQPQTPASPDVAQEIASVRERFLDAVRAEDLEELEQVFAPQGSMLAGGTVGRASGRETLLKLWRTVLAQFSGETILRSVRVQGSGDLAFDSGDFEETFVSESSGERYEVEGKYLMVYERQPSGQWMILEQAWVEVPKKSE